MRALIVLIIYTGICPTLFGAETNFVTLKTVGQVSGEMKDRVKGWVSANIASVSDGGGQVLNSTNFKEIAMRISGCSTNQETVTLVLVNLVNSDPRYLFITNGVAAINLYALLLPLMISPESREIFGRRVEKESVAGVARLLGFTPCPFPRCALYEEKTKIELDEKSCNLCPPCFENLPNVIEKYMVSKSLLRGRRIQE